MKKKIDNIIDNNIDNSVEKIDSTIDNNIDNIDNTIGNIIDNNIDNSLENLDSIIDKNIHKSVENIDNTIGHTIDNIFDNSTDNNKRNTIDNSIVNISNTYDDSIYNSIGSSIVNSIDINLDTTAINNNECILELECTNKKYSFKATYYTNSSNETVKLMNYIPNKIIDMIVDGIQINERENQNNWYTFHSNGDHKVCILMNITNCTSLEHFLSGIRNMISITFTPEFNTENLEHIDFMFTDCSSLVSINFSNLNTKNLKTMEGMFHSCISLQSMDFSNLDLRNVEIMYKFCYICYSLVSVNFTNTRTLNLTSYPGMFGGCFKLTSIELPNFKIRNSDGMFEDCPNLRYIDLRSISCHLVYDLIYYVSRYGTLILNSNCSNVVPNRFSNWTIIKV